MLLFLKIHRGSTEYSATWRLHYKIKLQQLVYTVMEGEEKIKTVSIYQKHIYYKQRKKYTKLLSYLYLQFVMIEICIFLLSAFPISHALTQNLS